MARLRMLFLAVLAVMALVAPTAVLAQQPKYEVKPGDTLWELAGGHLKDPLKWGQVIGRNPFLKQPGRVFQRGDKVIVLINPGERLEGLLEITGEAPKPVPIAELGIAPPPPAVAGSAASNWTPLILLALIIVALFVALAAAIRSRDRLLAQMREQAVQNAAFVSAAAGAEARREKSDRAAQAARDELAALRAATAAPYPDPANAGPAIVEGGVPDDRPELALRRMAEVAQASQAMIAPGRALVPVPIGALERGFLTGRRPQGEPVRYRDGSVVRAVLNREPGFRQVFRFTQPDGSTVELATYFLQRCGNDVIRTGGIPEEEIIFEPVATVAAAPAQAEAATTATQPPTLIELMEPEVLPAGEPVAIRTVPAVVEIGLYPSGNGFVARIVRVSATQPKAGRARTRLNRAGAAGADAPQQ